MNREMIFQTSLLDITFKDRNKDYGAYALRRFYNKRMYFATCSMIVLSAIVCVFILTISDSQKMVVANIKKVFTPDRVITVFQPSSHTTTKTVAKVSHLKTVFKPQGPPKISTNININNLPATVPELLPSSLQPTGLNIDLQSSGYGNDDNKGDSKEAHVRITEEKPMKSPITDKVDVMPEYPGGLNALMAFLKKNLHAPEDIEVGDEIDVMIKFVVDYDGHLQKFDVVRSGGKEFDNEVIRVLKKMPSWIPGKSNGENVAVYYIIPVKFKSNF